MPKRKGGRKKRGGRKNTSLLANASNAHNAKNFSSNQGMVAGCAGCVDGNVAIGSGCNLQSQAAAQISANRGISRLMNGITGNVGKISQAGGASNTAVTTFKDLKNAAENGMGYGSVPVTGVNNCGVQSSTSLGAGQIARVQGGGGVNETASCVNGVNNLGTPGYGLNIKGTSDLNATVMGSGYPIVSPYNTNKCGGRRTRKRRKHKKRRRRTKHKRKKYRRSRKKRGGNGEDDGKKKKTSCAGIRNAFGVCMKAVPGLHAILDAQDTSLGQFKNKYDPSQLMGYPSGRGGSRRKMRKKRGSSRKKRGGDVSTLQKMQQKWQQYIGFPPRLRGGSCGKRHKKKRGGTRKKMKGGYSQFASNDPNTPGFSSPKPGPLPWATGPLSKSRQINCQDNYDHYTGKSSPSPVLDQAAPKTPFGGSGR